MSDRVIREGKGWGTIVACGLLLLMFGPMLLAGAFNTAIDNAVPAADDLTKPIPGNAKRTYDNATPPTSAAAAPPRSLSADELDARQQAKQIGDGLAKARAAQAQPATPVDPRGGLPAVGQAGGGSVVGALVPGAESVVRAIGPGLKAIGK